MADKTISELPAATSINPADLFVLQQQATNSARSLQGQVLVSWLTNYADGHGGIQSIAKTSTSGLVDTYTITYADGTVGTFDVTNGAKGDTGDQTYVWIKWAAQEPTADNQLSDNPDKWIGIYTGTASTAPATRTSYKWYEYKGEKGDKGDAISSVVKTSGTGEPGTTDTYTMYVGQQSIGTFTVYNGLNGTGSVNTVNNILPDGSGNVSLNASDVGAVPVGQGVPGGGNAGDVLSKNSSSAYDVGWVSPTRIVELWTNSDPTADFAGQTISLQANSCTEFEVTYYFASNRSRTVGVWKFRPGEECLASVAATTNMDIGTFSGVLLRNIPVCTQTSITFGDARVATTSNNTANNSFMIPLRVVGYYY